MNDRLKELAEQATNTLINQSSTYGVEVLYNFDKEKFAELIIQECIDSIETYEIPIGNSPAGEMASEWTYDALKTIRDDINEKFGIK